MAIRNRRLTSVQVSVLWGFALHEVVRGIPEPEEIAMCLAVRVPTQSHGSGMEPFANYPILSTDRCGRMPSVHESAEGMSRDIATLAVGRGSTTRRLMLRRTG